MESSSQLGLRDPVYITTIQLRNCQVLGNCVISLSPGLNVIVGSNNAGKTVLFKLIKISCTQGTRFHKKVKDVIRRECEQAVCLFHFSDGSCGGVILYPKLIQYVYRENESLDYLVATSPIPIFLEKMGLIVEDNFILNLLDADQELLLVNSSPKTNFNLVKLIAHDQDLDSLRDRSKIELEKYEEWQFALNKKITIINSMLQVSDYTDTTQLEQSVGVSEMLLPFAQETVTLLGMLEDLNFDDIGDVAVVAPLLGLLGDLEELCMLLENIVIVDGIPDQIEELLGIAQVVEELRNEINTLDLGDEYRLREMVDESLQELLDTGLIVTCPVKGEVIYCEEASCIYCGHGSSQE